MTTKINASQLYSKKELLALMKVKGRAWDMLLTEVKKQLGLPPDTTLEPRLEAGMEGAFPEVFMEDYLFMESPDKPAASARCIIVAGGMPNEEGGVVWDVTLAFPVQGTEAFAIVDGATVVTTVTTDAKGREILGLARADQISAIAPADFN